MQTYDVIVLGVGSMGGAAAAELAGRGLRVLGLEQFWPGHDRGSAHGGTRIVRQSYFEGAAYVPLLRRAYVGWRALEEASGRELLTLCGGLYVGDEDSAVVVGSLASAREHGLAYELLSAGEIRRRFPTMAPAPHAVGVYEAAAGYTRPEETTFATVQVARSHGAEIRFDERVVRWSPTPGGGVQVETVNGTYGADRLVVTPGAWAPELLGDLALPLRVERQMFAWFTPELTDAVPYARYTDVEHPVYVEETDGNGILYGFPMVDGPDGGLKLAFFRQDGPPTTPQGVDRTVHPHEVAALRSRALELFPHLTGPLVTAKTCLYTTTRDEHFVVGLHPGVPQVAVACGFSGHGFKFVPVIGEVLADLVVDGATPHDITLFDPLRGGLRPRADRVT
ncbi:N-methyl-L-tryptophan oxidase [Actinotalea sp. K2]|uniref:N-methyl-L-tryptophan oxidase n=1 Tax=Actinotalea sp. K2 TaxID=2939438 RepID=UPI002017E8D1|nr:N-methyl-L-tryptophan oxidase [Actinotalea sp. K2]MCL3860989.1 N-methyl-L-tryptophan oxidase [Actinotalea sp. K2]